MVIASCNVLLLNNFFACSTSSVTFVAFRPVSYTHLDVYKRQILLDGYTGMGKTTVSKELAKQDNSIILNNDEVRAFLNDYIPLT